MDFKTGNTGGVGHKVEELGSMDDPVRMTGGDPHARRFRNDYSKANHAKQDAASKEDNAFPDVSGPKILGLFR